jgi:hypothetical protein
MTIVKKGSQYELQSKGSGKTLGTHATKAQAEKQEAAIQISKARASGHDIPKKK